MSAVDDEPVMGLDDDNEDEEVTLKSKDGKLFKLSRKAASLSEFIKTALESESGSATIELFHIDSEIVGKVVEYLNYRQSVPPRPIERPLPSNNLKELVDEWDSAFADCSQEQIFKTLLAANYMDIKPLLMLMCAKIALMIKSKTPPEIRKTFNIRDDYTPEEEARVKKEYRDLLE
eukprot:TRINITY_DN65816_c0_g1_i1.p3 TRINITY_DN65816_c0_g1~~TRINITY_DN65816_c0_g1_i1.p3  ORF type:complete len:195 (+),score=120.22 TRINITY_DN65816_c0_g1_i1:58-585(+)